LLTKTVSYEQYNFKDLGTTMKKLTLILLTAISLQLNGCATTTKDSVSGVNRSQFMLLPASILHTNLTRISKEKHAQHGQSTTRTCTRYFK